MEGLRHLDDRFFGINPREPSSWTRSIGLFPRVRLGGPGDAGYDPEGLTVRAGWYAGRRFPPTLLFHLIAIPRWLPPITAQVIIGNAADSLTTPGVSYKLNLKGPSHSLNSGLLDLAGRRPHACQALLQARTRGGAVSRPPRAAA